MLDNACSFETRVKELLTLVWNKLEDEERDVLCNVLDERCSAKEKLAQKNMQDVSSQPENYFLNAVNHRYFLSHADRLIILCEAIKMIDNNYECIPEGKLQNIWTHYEQDFNRYRNALSHIHSTDTVITVGGRQVAIDQELHRTLRKSIAEYEGLFSRLNTVISKLKL